MPNTIVLGDSKEVLSKIEKETFHLCFTSPPYYNAREYSTYQDYPTYLKVLRDIFSEVHRTLKEGRFLVVNTSPVLEPRKNRNFRSHRFAIPFDLHQVLVELGFEFIDDIIWLKPESSVKNRGGNFFQNRKPLAYKPNIVTEYVMVYRKYTEKLIDWNIKQYSQDVIEESKVQDGYERTNVWSISPKSDKVHPAIFPQELSNRVIQYYSFKGDLVLDPFAGSGTVGKSCIDLGREYYLIEKEEKYVNHMKNNLNTLFNTI